jgi:Dynamin central region
LCYSTNDSRLTLICYVNNNKINKRNTNPTYAGVLTKVDLINPGGEDEVLSVVTNVRKPLALGYIMVKNRSQLDLNNNMTTAQAR